MPNIKELRLGKFKNAESNKVPSLEKDQPTILEINEDFQRNFEASAESKLSSKTCKKDHKNISVVSENSKKNLGQSEDKLRTTPPDNNNIDLNTIIINDERISENQQTIFDFPQEWMTIDFSLLSPIGFSMNHLTQIFQKSGLPLDAVQDSINAFAFDLFQNGKEKSVSTPLKMFMGILVKGQVYNAPDNYESPKDKAMRLYIEQKRREKEKRKVMEEEAREHAFEERQDTLSEAEQLALVPDHVKTMNPTSSMTKKIIESEIEGYFVDHVWPERKQMIS